MEKILHQLIWYNLQGFIHVRWWSPDFFQFFVCFYFSLMFFLHVFFGSGGTKSRWSCLMPQILVWEKKPDMEESKKVCHKGVMDRYHEMLGGDFLNIFVFYLKTFGNDPIWHNLTSILEMGWCHLERDIFLAGDSSPALFSSPNWRSLYLWKGHVFTIPKNVNDRIARYTSLLDNVL